MSNSVPAVLHWMHTELQSHGCRDAFSTERLMMCACTIHCVSKRDPDIIDCNFGKDLRILMIFGTSIPKATGHQMAIQFPTSPNICFYTTWGKQNIRNMHWNGQQTSTNWRLHHIKIWLRWSELMKNIVYFLTIVAYFLLSNVSLVTRSCFSRTLHQHIGAQNDWTVRAQNPRYYLSGSVPPQQP